MISSPNILNLVLALALLCAADSSSIAQEQAPPFTQVVVFGDSLSDTGNVRERTDEESGGLVDYPSHTFNYSNGRFTNDGDTDPGSNMFLGVWHEQLAGTFLGIPAASFSLGGGLNFAFGGATTNDGTHEEVAVQTPFGDITITIDDMGKQVNDYLSSHIADSNALYIVWGGANDLRNDDSPESVTATAARATALAGRLATAGARHIMVPNVPPLGDIPRYADDPARIVALNEASANYRQMLNQDLDQLLLDLATQGITPTIYRPDIWVRGIGIFSDPARFGFTNTTGPAQDQSVNPDQYLFWDDVHPTTSGHYQLAKAAYDSVTIPPSPLAKAVNIATRVFVDVGERISIAGFVITGDLPKRVIIRGIGPSLGAFGVPNLLADPVLALFDGNGTALMSNDNWEDSQGPEITATGIPPQNPLEAAIVAVLPPGNYTAALAGRDNTTGNGLVEVYDLQPGDNTTLANLSTRGFVGVDDNVLIGSLIISSGDIPIVVVRAIGPSLATSGIAEPLLDPTIELHDGNGATIGFNDNWNESQLQAVSGVQLVPTDDRESVIVAPFLTAGNYTAIVRGKDNSTGVALVEAYRLQ
jgi:phospholipase/lecithinase/hemolysin